MTLDSYRTHAQPFLKPVVDGGIRLGLTPDRCTFIAFFAAIIAGFGYYKGDILIGTLGIFFNAFFDALDGAIARTLMTSSLKGDFLDHTVDRYADIFIICGVFSGPFCQWQIGVFGLTGVLMASYLGTQAQAVGVGRFYGGLLGRADRLILLMVAGLVSAFIPASILGLSVLAWVLVLFGVLGHITAFQRFLHVWGRI